MTTKQTILAVDDDHRTIDLLSSALDMLGVQLISTDNAQEAIEMAREQAPDLIFMDLLLPAPSLRGWDAVRVLKNDPALANIPVVILTAAGGEGIQRGMQAGANDFLEKPFTFNQLRNTVGRILQPAQT